MPIIYISFSTIPNIESVLCLDNILLHAIMFKILYGKEEEIKDIIVTDLNSKDKTKEIIEKMANDYEYLKVSNWKECKDIIDNIDNN